MNGARVDNPKIGPGAFRAKELWGSLFDLWFLIPLVGLMVASERGGSAGLMGRDLLVMGGAWALSALLFRTPLPLQPLKVWAFLFLILRPTAEVASLSAVLLGLLLFLSGHFGLSGHLEARLSDRSFARVRKAVTLYVRGVAFLAFGLVLLRHFSGLLPLGLVSLLPGMSPSPVFSVLLLVLPQFPVTLINGILATVRERRAEGGLSPSARRLLTGEGLSRWLGAADLLAGAAGGLPFCHGAGNLWIYRRHKIQSILPSLVSSAALIGLGFLLLRGAISLSSPLVYAAFLVGFLLAEQLLKRGTKAPVDLRFRDRSGPDPFEVWAVAGGVVSGAILLGGIPLLLVLLLGMNAAVTVSSGGFGEITSFADGRGSSGGQDEWIHATGQFCDKNGSGALANPSGSGPLFHCSNHGNESEGLSPTPVLAREDATAQAHPERFFRRAREIPARLFLAVLLLLFFFDPSPLLVITSDPDRPGRQNRVHSLLAPLRAP